MTMDQQAATTGDAARQHLSSGTQANWGSEQLERLAMLVAAGQAPWPTDLNEATQRELREIVRRHLRSRMMTLFAAAVARRLERERVERRA
jgi:hypothetical protein